MTSARGMLRLPQLLCAAVLVSTSGVANANLVINNTRVIYNSATRDVTVNVTNEGLRPSLMQSWIDSGNPESIPDEEEVPFSLVPPVARIDGDQSQALKITWNGDPLPMDRESVFYLNVMDIPPEPCGANRSDRNYVQFAIRTRIKLFFRPRTLTGKADSAARQLTWQQIGHAIRLYNPTPFYVSINQVRDAGGQVTVSSDLGMVPPFGTTDFAVASRSHVQKGADLQVESINDYGGNTLSVVHAR